MPPLCPEFARENGRPRPLTHGLQLYLTVFSTPMNRGKISQVFAQNGLFPARRRRINHLCIYQDRRLRHANGFLNCHEAAKLRSKQGFPASPTLRLLLRSQLRNRLQTNFPAFGGAVSYRGHGGHRELAFHVPEWRVHMPRCAWRCHMTNFSNSSAGISPLYPAALKRSADGPRIAPDRPEHN